jgi:uncharacterized protein YaiE (UPF0345 family)
MSQIHNVSLVKKANVYFDGKCVSHTLLFPDGTRKSVGVIFPSALTFQTEAPETMEITSGCCRIRLDGELGWKTYRAGDSFVVPPNSWFEIETSEMVDYVCHFG